MSKPPRLFHHLTRFSIISHCRAMPYIIYWFIGWRFSSRSLSSAGFDSEISFLSSLKTRSVWSPLFSSPLLSSEEEDDDDEGSCWTLIWTSLSEDKISQLITLKYRITEHVVVRLFFGGKNHPLIIQFFKILTFLHLFANVWLKSFVSWDWSEGLRINFW